MPKGKQVDLCAFDLTLTLTEILRLTADQIPTCFVPKPSGVVFSKKKKRKAEVNKKK